MAIYDILCAVKDRRDQEGICEFNGYLEDYLTIIEKEETKPETAELLKHIFSLDEDVRICVQLALNINKDAIANQIIRYKDSFKLPHGTIKCPMIVYGKFDGAQRAVILTIGKQEEYVLAKALYYVMSEPENEYEGCRNELIACSMSGDHSEFAFTAIERFFIQGDKAGMIQRQLDTQMFLNYEEMYETAQKMASYQLVNLKELLKECEDKESMINQMIATWFLLKKFSYVQYMMDKNNLHDEHGGNVKKQRQRAKERCDAIGFVSYSELWRLVKELKSQ